MISVDEEENEKGKHHHFATKKEMKTEMIKNWNPYDTFSYGVLLPKPTGIYLQFLRTHHENIDQMIFKKIKENIGNT